MNDQSLGDTTAAQSASASPFHRPDPAPIDTDLSGLVPTVPLTIDEILAKAKLPERRTHICLAADLQARYDEIVEELSTLVNAQGELVVDAEAAIGDQSAEARAQQLADDLAAVRQQMKNSSVSFLFRGMPAEDLAIFEKAHKPKDPNADFTDWYCRLIARSAVEPVMDVPDVQKFRQTLGFNAFWQLCQTAQQVNMGGGVDVPKSLGFSQVRTGN